VGARHTVWVGDRLRPGVFVVVSGPRGSGKTTLSGAIAPALGLPLIAKDTIMPNG
jgi:adenylate kinase family enzyme